MTECSIINCSRQSLARTWCAVHYKRWKRTGKPEGLYKLHAISKIKTCSVNSCSRKYYAKSFCRLHWMRQKNNQDINAPIFGSEARIKHHLYNGYRSMLRRCDSPNSNHYSYYGGRGITVCERWKGKQGFINFCNDVSDRPEGKTLDRIDNNGNYEPGNVRWATPYEQQQNTRRALLKLQKSGIIRE